MGRPPLQDRSNLVICKCGARFLKVSDFTDHVSRYRITTKRKGRTPLSVIYINSLHGVDADAMLDEFEDKETKR